MDYSNIPTGLKITSQIPLNVKEYVKDEATLAYLGINDNLAYTYHDQLEILCLEEKTIYRWREVQIGEENTGLVPLDFTYPSGLPLTFGIDYSNKVYNFFKVDYITLDSINAAINIINLGSGVKPYKGYNASNDSHEFRTITKENLGTGKSFLKDIQENADELNVRVRTLVSDNLTITLTEDEEVRIETPMTATIPALYVNNLYVPTYNEWLTENKIQNGGTAISGFIFRGKGSLAQPFANSITYPLLGGSATITADTAIQNALDAYVGTGTRLSPELSGQKIIIQDNTGSYNFTGNFGYSNLYVKIEGNVLSTTTGYIIDADNILHFNNVDTVTVEILSGALFQIQGLGFNNPGSTVATNNFVNTKTINLLGEGYIFTDTNNINNYIINSDILETGNNNDGGLTFDIKCNIRAVYQGVYKIGGVSRIDFYNVVQSGDLGLAVNTSLKAFNQIGGQVRIFNTSTVIFEGVGRSNAFTFEPSTTYSTTLLCSGNSFQGFATTMFNKLNNNTCSFSVVNSQSSIMITNVFDSTNLWTLNFRENTFTSGVIDFTKVDLTQGNNISSINTIGNNVIESLRVYSSKANAKLAGIGENSLFLKRNVYNAVDLIAGVEYKVVTPGSPSLGAVGSFFTATGSETGTGTASLETREILT